MAGLSEIPGGVAGVAGGGWVSPLPAFETISKTHARGLMNVAEQFDAAMADLEERSERGYSLLLDSLAAGFVPTAVPGSSPSAASVVRILAIRGKVPEQLTEDLKISLRLRGTMEMLQRARQQLDEVTELPETDEVIEFKRELLEQEQEANALLQRMHEYIFGAASLNRREKPPQGPSLS